MLTDFISPQRAYSAEAAAKAGRKARREFVFYLSGDGDKQKGLDCGQ